MAIEIASPLLARSIVWSVYAIVPFWYLVVAARVSGFVRVPRLVVAVAAAEVAFSLYHAYLIRRCQVKLPPHEHDEPFLRSVMLRALGTGMAPVFPHPPRSRPTTPSSPPRLAVTSNQQQHHPSRPISPSGFAPKQARLDFDDPRALDFRQHHALWFGGCKWSDIYRDNLREWLAWVLYGTELEDATLQQSKRRLAFIEQCRVWIENRAGDRLPKGYNPKLQGTTIRLTLDRVRVQPRPLVLYAVTGMATALTKQMLYRHGFRHVTYAGVDVLVRVPLGWKAREAEKDPMLRPIVFIHGLGLGLAQYASTMHYLATAPLTQCRPLLFPLQPSIVTEFFHPSHLAHPSQDSMTRALVDAVSSLGWTTCGLDLVGHSYGSIIAGWLVKAAPHLVKRLCLIDPVCFCLWEAYVAYNVLYARPKTGMEILMRYFVGCEIGVALSLQRHFSWTSNILFPADVPGFSDPERTTVFLAGQDPILNAPRIRSYLLENGMQDADSAVVVDELTGETKTKEGDGKGQGGLVVAWEGVHGQSLWTGTEQFARIVRWLEGKGLSKVD